MNDLSFYPILTQEQIKEAEIICFEYVFKYEKQDYDVVLNSENISLSIINVEEPQGDWTISENGMKISKIVQINNPSVLYGKDGVISRNAKFSVAILWKNFGVKQAGCILSESVSYNQGKWEYAFSHEFRGGELKGRLEMQVVLYIKEAAEKVDEGEEFLINEDGAVIGILETVNITGKEVGPEFPIKNKEMGKNGPLWVLDLDNWDDPFSDPFDENYVCLYLNQDMDERLLPMKNDSEIRNPEILIEILSTSYFLIIQKLENLEYLTEIKNGNKATEGSIAAVIQNFINSNDLDFSSPEKLRNTIFESIREKIQKG